MSYKDSTQLDTRISESNRILSKYPDRIPIIVEYDKTKINMKKQKFLVPKSASLSYLLVSIRNQINMANNNDNKVNNMSYFLFCDKKLVIPSSIINELYWDHIKNKEKVGNLDKFLYLYLSTENTFGSN
jgi:GABA(A) receptor-associated protein